MVDKARGIRFDESAVISLLELARSLFGEASALSKRHAFVSCLFELVPFATCTVQGFPEAGAPCRMAPSHDGSLIESQAPSVDAGGNGDALSVHVGDPSMPLALDLFRTGRLPRFTAKDRKLVEMMARLALESRRSCEETDFRLSPRELQVARLASLGQGDREIASSLKIGYETVRTHLKRIFFKVGVNNRTELAHRLLGPRP